MSHGIHLLLSLQIKSAKPKDKPYRLQDGGNLYVEVKPSGGKYWYSKYWYLGREKRISHGPFPIVSCDDAREKHQAAKRLLLNNIDPALAKREAKRILPSQVLQPFVKEGYSVVFLKNWKKEVSRLKRTHVIAMLRYM